MDFSLNLLSKSLFQAKKNVLKFFSKIRKIINFVVKKSEKVRPMAIKKVQIWKERFVVQPWDHKKWIPWSIYNQNHYILVRKKFFLNLSTSMLLQNVSFWLLHEKVQILKEQFFVEPWDHRNWISHSIYNQNHCVLVKNNFSNLF